MRWWDGWDLFEITECCPELTECWRLTADNKASPPAGFHQFTCYCDPVYAPHYHRREQIKDGPERGASTGFQSWAESLPQERKCQSCFDLGNWIDIVEMRQSSSIKLKISRYIFLPRIIFLWYSGALQNCRLCLSEASYKRQGITRRIFSWPSADVRVTRPLTQISNHEAFIQEDIDVNTKHGH